MQETKKVLAENQQVQNCDTLKKKILSMIEGKTDVKKIELIITN